MTDLLTKLETHVAIGGASPGFHLSTEDFHEIIRALRAADEIERLRAENVGLRGALDSIRSIVLAARDLEQNAKIKDTQV